MCLGFLVVLLGGIGQVFHQFGGHAEIWGAVHIAHWEGEVEPYELDIALVLLWGE